MKTAVEHATAANRWRTASGQAEVAVAKSLRELAACEASHKCPTSSQVWTRVADTQKRVASLHAQGLDKENTPYLALKFFFQQVCLGVACVVFRRECGVLTTAASLVLVRVGQRPVVPRREALAQSAHYSA